MIAASDWPVLVTGAGGFVGGHVARELARAGHPVRGLVRRGPWVERGDPPIGWRTGDLRDQAFLREAVSGVRAVVHSAGWVSLGPDRSGEARAVNIEATRVLLDEAEAAGVERFVYTSTLHTLAAGTAEHPADENSTWNLGRVDSPYARTKGEAERLVLDRSGARMTCLALCPGMVLGPRDRSPTSTAVLLAMARHPLVVVPGGGIPIIDARVLAFAHREAISRGEPGRRYAVVGPYLGYAELARIVGRLAGRPRRVVDLPDAAETPLAGAVALARLLVPPLRRLVPSALVAGAFLRLHVRGDRADAAFGLVHPSPESTIFETLVDAARSGRAPWLRLPGLERPQPQTA